MKRAAPLFLVLLLPLVGGQGAVGQEDFEDDTIGELPSEEWYTLVGYRAGNEISASTQVVACNVDEAATGGNCLQTGLTGAGNCGLGGGAGGPCGAAYFFNAGALQPAFVEFALGRDASTSGEINFCGAAGDTDVVIGIQNCAFSTQIFHVGLNLASPNCVLRVHLAGGMFDNLETVSLAEDCSRVWRVELDWTNEEFTVLLNGTEVGGPHPFRTSQSSMTFVASGKGTSGLFRIDDIQVDGAADVVIEDREPAEFDQGLIELLGRLGFVSEGSQLFFVLMLLGFVILGTSAVMKWVASGKLKNNLIGGLQALFAVFAIFLGFLDLWMFLLALILNIFAINTGSVLRNTFWDIRDAVDDARDRAAFAIQDFRGQAPPRQGPLLPPDRSDDDPSGPAFVFSDGTSPEDP